jgi:hypothetical protein
MDALIWFCVWAPICLYAWYSLEKSKQAPGEETQGPTEDSTDGYPERQIREAENDLYLDTQWWSR